MDELKVVKDTISLIGDNCEREGVIDTPTRVTKMWKEIFKGYNLDNKPKVTVFNNGKDGIIYNEMITDSGEFYSMCEHHMLPFFGKYYFAYIPNKKILGLSKVARIVDFYASKLQVQERLTIEIVNELESALKPKGIALIMEAEHMCKSMRGVKKKGTMLTSELRGVFKKHSIARNEFLMLRR